MSLDADRIMDEMTRYFRLRDDGFQELAALAICTDGIPDTITAGELSAAARLRYRLEQGRGVL